MTPPPRDGVNTLPFDRAADFLAALSPASDHWGHDPSEWIFRGQANAEWPLRPKAARGAGAFIDFGINGDTDDVFARKGMVEQALEAFRKGLDRSGIPIPAEPPEIDRVSKMSSSVEPNLEVFPLMALAQHHGLPTLFLDWSRLAYVAAYFAAAGALDPVTTGLSTHLAVWALRIVIDDKRMSWSDLRLYQAPGATNPYLRAQHGLFTILDSEKVSSIEEHVAHTPQDSRWQFELRRLTLPVHEAGRLLRLLSFHGIDGASMFPGADGVVRAMRERKFHVVR